MAELLVTGGAGCIASKFVHYWLSAHPKHCLTVPDALPHGGDPASMAAVKDHPSFRFPFPFRFPFVAGNSRGTPLVEQLPREG